MTRAFATTIVIPTLNRPSELARLIKSIEKQTKRPSQVIIVDQSANPTIQNSEKIQILHQTVPFKGLTKARNHGLASVKTSFTTFLDDDVEIGESYLAQVEDNLEKTNALLIGGIPWNPGQDTLERPTAAAQLFRQIFGLGHPAKKWKILPSADITYNPNSKKLIPSEWISGSNFTVETQLAKQVGFDENLQGYCLGEDIDFSLGILEAAPGRTFLDPYLPVIHHASALGRITDKRFKVMQGCHHYYFYHKHRETKNWSAFSLARTRVGYVLLSAIQNRIGGVIPHPHLLVSNLLLEWNIIKARKQIRSGHFLY